jgi:hypothetical protein
MDRVSRLEGAVLVVLGTGMLLTSVGLGGALPATEVHEAWTLERSATAAGTVVATDTARADCGDLWTRDPCTAAVVRYRYTVDDQTYVASGAVFRGLDGVGDPRFTDPAAATAYLSRHEAGGRVTVHYLTSDPARSYLDPPDPDWGVAALGLGVGGVFFVLGLFVLSVGQRLVRGLPLD